MRTYDKTRAIENPMSVPQMALLSLILTVAPVRDPNHILQEAAKKRNPKFGKPACAVAKTSH